MINFEKFNLRLRDMALIKNNTNLQRKVISIQKVRWSVPNEMKRQLSNVSYTLQNLLQEKGAYQIEDETISLEQQSKEIDRQLKDLYKEPKSLEEKIETMTNAITQSNHEISFLKAYFMVREDLFDVECKRTGKVSEVVERSSHALLLASKHMKETSLHKFHSQLVSVYTQVRGEGLEDYPLTRDEKNVGSMSLSLVEFPQKEEKIRALREDRERSVITITVNGMKMSPTDFYHHLEIKIENQAVILTKEEERLVKEVVIQNLGEKIRGFIIKAKKWRDSINQIMRNINNSIQLNLKWEPIDNRSNQDELTTTKLVQLLNKEFDSLKPEDGRLLIKHFLAKIDHAKEQLRNDQNTKMKTLEDAIRAFLDYREWYQFSIRFQLKGELEKTLNLDTFSKLSGGEKAMAMYIPLFSAAYSKYKEASSEAPYLIALDEAFAGVDEENIQAMFSLMEQLEFNYVLTSQALWGEYETVRGLSIAELYLSKEDRTIDVVQWIWNGNQRYANPISSTRLRN